VVALASVALSGCEARLGDPQMLWVLWLVPVVAAVLLWSARRRRRGMAVFADAGMLPRLIAGRSPAREVLKAFLILVGLAAMVLALARPRWGFTWEEVQRRGVDIVVALDVSDSMLVEDVEAGGGLSRLERAKRKLADLLGTLEGDRIAFVAFAGTAFVQCPLTLDYAAAELFLRAVEPDLVPLKGTDLAEALDVSRKAFDASPSSKAIILITDGEDHEGRVMEAVERVKDAGIRVFTIGIGREEGSPIPAPGGGYRRDRSGEVIMSRFNEALLQKVALETGGRSVRSVTGDLDLETIYDRGIKATMEDSELGSRRRQRWEERFQWALGLALVALALEPLVGERSRRREER
jgi:Ca-activated chloride channel family protein